jgi:hypothetical protein
LDSGVGVDPWADPADSSRDLFFPAPVFMLFNGEDFILQMHRVFTHIRSGDSLVANSGGARGSTDCSTAAVARMADSWLDLFQMTANVGVENPKGFGLYL